MGEDVKRRSYSSSRRRAQSADTRRRVLAAARELLLLGGYRSTTIAAIAARAEVNPDTVYQLVGSKPALVRELIEQSVSGTDQAVPPEERDYVQAIRAQPDASQKLQLYAQALVRTQQRLAPLYKLIQEAAPSQPELASLWREISERRFANMHTFIADVETARPLRPGLSNRDAATHVWTLNSPEVYLLLTEERRWSPDDVARWLAATWERLFFDS